MRRVRLVLAALGVAALAAGCLPGPNGRFPPSALTPISPECVVANDIAIRLAVMLAEAQAAGIGLAPERSSYLPAGVAPPPRIESCYRSYDMQVWWRNYYCSIGKCGLAAVPGTSKHGLGRAVDFEDGGGELTWSSPGYRWLYANAARFGFFQPPSVQFFGPNPEPWHWESG
jgi:peptidoglycan DL-endopeptidase CwlO